MADSKTTNLTEDTSFVDADLIATITDVATTPANRKMTGANFVVSAPFTSRYQPLDAELTALAGLTSAANKIPRFTGSGTAALSDFIDDDTMATASATNLASAESTKAYTDNTVTALDEMADGVRTTIDTGTPGFQAVDVALSGGIAGGDTLTGGTASGEDLTLASTAHATRGTIFIRDIVELLAEDKTNATTTPVTVLDVPNTRTITLADTDSGNFYQGNAFSALKFAPTIIFDETGGSFGSGSLFVHQATIKNRNAETRTIGSMFTFADLPLFQADGATVTFAGTTGLHDVPTFSVLSSGVLNVAAMITVKSGATVNTGATVTARVGFQFVDSTGAGTVTTAVGVEIGTLADATTSIGIRNASTSVKTPTANASITATSATISHAAAIVTLTANNSYTLASTPTITDGQQGEELLIINVDTADTITIQDQGTLASSNLRLVSTTIALGPRDSIRLVYNTTVGDWVQVSPVTNVI